MTITSQELRTILERKIKSETKELQDLISVSDPSKNKEILLLKYVIANQTEKLRFLRPSTIIDANYRQRQLAEFSDCIEKVLPESAHFMFHGTTIYNTEKILRSGSIVSGKDIWNFSTSGNRSNEISVTTQKDIHTTVLGYAGLNTIGMCLPAGVIFVLRPENDEEYQMAEKDCQIHNVNFQKNPHRLYGLITTPENLKRVKDWMKQYHHSQPVFDYDGFIRHFQRQPLQRQILPHQKTIA